MFFNVQLKKFWGERGCLVERKQKFWPPNLPKQISNIKELWYPCMAIFSQPQKWENLAFTSTFMQSWNLPPLPDLVTDKYQYGPLASPASFTRANRPPHNKQTSERWPKQKTTKIPSVHAIERRHTYPKRKDSKKEFWLSWGDKCMVEAVECVTNSHQKLQ